MYVGVRWHFVTCIGAFFLRLSEDSLDGYLAFGFQVNTGIGTAAEMHNLSSFAQVR